MQINMISEKIIKLRKQNNMTQRALAKKLNLSHTAIGKYERHEAEPDIKTLILLSNIFNVSIDYLVKDDVNVIFVLKDDLFKVKSLSEEISHILKRM